MATKTPLQLKPIYHLENKDDLNELQQHSHHRDFKNESFMLETYVETGSPSMMYKNDVLVLDRNEELYMISNGLIYSISEYGLDSLFQVPLGENGEVHHLGLGERLNERTSLLVGLVLPKPIKGMDTKLGLIINGDEENNQLVDTVLINCPTISFNCLGRFYNSSDRHVFARIVNGDCKILEFTPQEQRPLTTKEQKEWDRYVEFQGAVRQGKKPKKVVTAPQPPEPGFVKVNGMWHRSSTVLFYDRVENFTILMGVDEDQYFGSQLATNSKSIANAYASLIPKELKNEGDLVRQGEWFFVLVNEDEVPPVEKSIALFDRIVLPVEHSTSHAHWVLASNHIEEFNSYDVEDETIETPTHGRIGQDGTIYVYHPTMVHAQHVEVRVHGWHRFVRNTAIRSFSEGGVD